jgi:hypothetical protein
MTIGNGMSKRTIAVSVKLSEKDWQLLKRAADKLWPDAILSNSSIVLGLARIAATRVLTKNSRK